MSGNLQSKPGIVKENDPKRGMSRVQIEDEDEVSSFWMAWNMPAAGGSKFYNQPDIGSQVNCLYDPHAESGVILGARYSEKDTPPTQDGKALMAQLEGGGLFHYDKASGKIILKAPGGLEIEADVKITGSSVKHNNKNIGSTHRHDGVEPGGGNTGEPQV